MIPVGPLVHIGAVASSRRLRGILVAWMGTSVMPSSSESSVSSHAAAKYLATSLPCEMPYRVAQKGWIAIETFEQNYTKTPPVTKERITLPFCVVNSKKFEQ